MKHSIKKTWVQIYEYCKLTSKSMADVGCELFKAVTMKNAVV